jgi:hypothetical protein
MIEVFKTNVQEQGKADELVVLLKQHFPAGRINFDLHDCDKILRVEANHIEPEKVMKLVKEKGFACTVLL